VLIVGVQVKKYNQDCNKSLIWLFQKLFENSDKLVLQNIAISMLIVRLFATGREATLKRQMKGLCEDVFYSSK